MTLRLCCDVMRARAGTCSHRRLINVVLNDVGEGEGHELVALAAVELALELDPVTAARKLMTSRIMLQHRFPFIVTRS